MTFPSLYTQFECGLSTFVSPQMIFPSLNTQFERGFSTILSFGNSQQNISLIKRQFCNVHLRNLTRWLQ